MSKRTVDCLGIGWAGFADSPTSKVMCWKWRCREGKAQFETRGGRRKLAKTQELGNHITRLRLLTSFSVHVSEWQMDFTDS